MQKTCEASSQKELHQFLFDLEVKQHKAKIMLEWDTAGEPPSAAGICSDIDAA